MTKSIEKNDVVVINLDRPRFLRYGHRALKKLGALTGKGLADLGENDFDLEEMEKIIYCGLLSDAKENGETLKLEDMEDLLDQAESYNELLEAMNLALTNAFGPGDEKN
jgi:predicted solute-binding protein